METYGVYFVLAMLFAGWLLWLAHRETLQEHGHKVSHPLRNWLERHRPRPH